MSKGIVPGFSLSVGGYAPGRQHAATELAPHIVLAR